MAAPAAEAFADDVDGLLVDRVAGGLDEALDALGVAGAGEVDAVDALGEGLLDHPAAGGDGRFVEAEQGQGDDDGGRPVAARGGAGVDQAAHELAERREVERHVLDVVDDVVAPGAGHPHAFLVAAGGGVVVDGVGRVRGVRWTC